MRKKGTSSSNVSADRGKLSQPNHVSKEAFEIKLLHSSRVSMVDEH